MGTDLADARVMQIADKLVCFRCAADRVIEDEGRPHAITSEDLLGSILASHRFDTDRAPRSVRGPVKFGLRVDDDDEHRRLLDWPLDRSPSVRVEHVSLVTLNGWQPRRLRKSRGRSGASDQSTLDHFGKRSDRNRTITPMPELCHLSSDKPPVRLAQYGEFRYNHLRY